MSVTPSGMLSACSYVYADKFTAFVQNVRLPKELLKSVYICQRYCKNKSDTFFWDTLYMLFPKCYWSIC